MSLHQTFKKAIETFQPGGSDSPILYTTTEVNDKGFCALLGRKIKSRPISVAMWIGMLIILAVSIASTIAFGQTGAPVFASFVPILIVLFLQRSTIISVGDTGLDFYFIDSKGGSKYFAYDMFSLSYDRITNIKVKTGKFNTSIRLEFTNEGKGNYIRTVVPNKMRKMNEQADNLELLHRSLQRLS